MKPLTGACLVTIPPSQSPTVYSLPTLYATKIPRGITSSPFYTPAISIVPSSFTNVPSKVKKKKTKSKGKGTGGKKNPLPRHSKKPNDFFSMKWNIFDKNATEMLLSEANINL